MLHIAPQRRWLTACATIAATGGPIVRLPRYDASQPARFTAGEHFDQFRDVRNNAAHRRHPHLWVKSSAQPLLLCAGTERTGIVVSKEEVSTTEDVRLFPGAFLLRDVFRQQECDNFIALGEAMDAYALAGRKSGDLRSRATFFMAEEINASVFARCRGFLPKTISIQCPTISKKRMLRTGSVCGLNGHWRLHRYEAGQRGSAHEDPSHFGRFVGENPPEASTEPNYGGFFRTCSLAKWALAYYTGFGFSSLQPPARRAAAAPASASSEAVQEHKSDRRSWLTFLIYLNDMEADQGGETVLYPAGFNLKMVNRAKKEVLTSALPEGTDDARAGIPDAIARSVRVRPRKGSVLCFFHGHHPHNLVHEAAEVRFGVKHTLATGVLYKC